MTDKFAVISIDKLLQLIVNQYNKRGAILGIPKELFFCPQPSDPFRLYRFGQLLETPIGVAAGPHTQMAQNIVAAWLCGARYIELKTVQTLDELEVPKPCIDMQDEGYNCEWSQELKINQSFDQYVNAWIIIHVLKHLFGWDTGKEAGVIFNMSVGYNLEGILKENVQWFFDKMADASEEIQAKVESIKRIYPAILKIDIPSKVSDNITLSTMHGCPPDEIEKIACYLLNDKQLHTTVKLNPTLLGKEILLDVMLKSGFETSVPDIAFEHDLKYKDAVRIITNLQQLATDRKLHFGIKLTNTLESLNNKEIFPKDQEMMYMSGKALHPIAVCLAEKLQRDFKNQLAVSFSAGVDAFNINDVIACGLYPATVCSDILKPGGYGRLSQYLDTLRAEFELVGASSITEFIIRKNKASEVNEQANAFANLEKYVKKVLSDKKYKRQGIKSPNIKTNKQLGLFDCIHAPCETTCPAHQGVPDYMYYASKNEFDKSKEIILNTNPFAESIGMVCDHTCQSKCTRINYDNSLLIRDVKRSVAQNSELSVLSTNVKFDRNSKKVAVIGAGPSGISCAYFLALSGFDVSIYEAKPKAGGMAAFAIPKYRLSDEVLDIEIESILNLGMQIHYNQIIDKQTFNDLRVNYDFIYIAAGAQQARPFFVEGMELTGILNPLEFLYATKEGKSTSIGKNVVVIGGGNTAMDAARTAKRLLGKNGKVRILYRRTVKQMPANFEEIKALLDENIEIRELINPLSVENTGDKVSALVCQKMALAEKDSSGREKPVVIEGSEFTVECDTIIPAIGQELDIEFINLKELKTRQNGYETQIPNVFIGGDALNGGVSVIAAVGDGRKVAQMIIDRCGINYNTKKLSVREKTNHQELMIRKAKRIPGQIVEEVPINQRNNFNLIRPVLSREELIKEASRCLLCDELCNICTTVCPNLAFFAFETEPFSVNLKNSSIKFELKQNTQILHIADWCNQCGNCNTFCPTAGAPYRDKPHLHLKKSSFDTNEQGYFIAYSASEYTLFYKNAHQLHSLLENASGYTYSNENFKLEINKQTFQIQNAASFAKVPGNSWIKAVEMSIILKGVKEFWQI